VERDTAVGLRAQALDRIAPGARMGLDADTHSVRGGTEG
jgi:hypothetical protein